MLTEKEKKELLKQLSEKQKTIYNLKKQLNKVNDQKEAWFKKKEKLSKKIGQLIRERRLSGTLK